MQAFREQPEQCAATGGAEHPKEAEKQITATHCSYVLVPVLVPVQRSVAMMCALRIFTMQPVPLDFLVQIRSRHVYRACGLADVPVVLAQFGEDVGALSTLLEVGEGRGFQQVAAHGGSARCCAADQAVDVA